MLSKLWKTTDAALDTVEVTSAEPPTATGRAFEVQVIFAQRTYRSDSRRAVHMRVAYSAGDRAKELMVEVPWESLAQLRSGMARGGFEVSDDDVLGFIVVPWALDQIPDLHPDDLPNAMPLTLDFGDGPQPLAVREVLSKYGLPI